MDDTRLLLLGPPQLEAGAQVAAIRLRKVGALLAYLAVENRAFSREHLAAMFWPELPHKSALSNLRRTLTSIRTLLQNGSIATDGDQVRLEHIRVDVAEFRSLISSEDTDHDPVKFERAVGLYRGDFLEGFNLRGCSEFDEWQDGVRERFRSAFESSLETLCRIHMENGDFSAALPHAHRWMEHDQWNELAHRALMTIYAQLGRVSAALNQYEDCCHHLAEAGLDPDEETRRLHRQLIELHAGSAGESEPALAAKVGPDNPRTERRQSTHVSPRRMVIVVTIVLVSILGFFGGQWLRRIASATDVGVTAIHVVRDSDELSGLGLVLEIVRPARRYVTFDIVFSTDSSIGLTRNHVVYHGRFDLRIGTNHSIYVDAESQILEYIVRHEVPIPPGWYTASVFVTPVLAQREERPADNSLASGEVFFFSGSGLRGAVELVVEHAGTRRIDEHDPLRIYLADPSLGQEDWGAFVTTRPGRFFLPLDAVPDIVRDENENLFLLLIHDKGGDLSNPISPGPEDLAGIFADVSGGVAYGTFTISSGLPVVSGGRYAVRFGETTQPGPDGFEPDDTLESGTVVQYASLPVEHSRSFHDRGDGTDDWDWYTILLEDRESLTVETRSAGNGWESDAAIDLSNGEKTYLLSGSRPDGGQYDSLEYVNDSGIDQYFHVCIHPRNKYDTIVNHGSGEYVVEFRK
jgi:DNA-binding SARP family transcriptional activator